MEDSSILDDIKKLLGIESSFTHFDTDILIHINSVFDTLFQLGVGPKEEAFHVVSRDVMWSEFLGDKKTIDSVKTYIYLKVKLLFDPPMSSVVMESYKQLIQEYEWRLNVTDDNPIS